MLADAGLERWVASLRASGTDGPPDLAALRAASRERGLRRPREPRLHAVRDRRGSGAAQRWYEPTGAERVSILFAHGGFWALGDLETHDRLCRRIAQATSARVVAVDYRRAPEHPWPAAVDDLVGALATLPGPVILAGDSAGGHLALLAALRVAASGGQPPGLALACPNADPTLTQPSAARFATGWGLELSTLRWAVAQWLPPEIAPQDPRVNLLTAPLVRLAPTVVVTADHDPLCDEGEALARRLAATGTEVVSRCEAGMVHGFVQNLDEVSPAAGAATQRWLEDLRDLVSRADAARSS